MIDKCSIRKFEPGDLPRLHEIRVAAFEPVFRSFRSILGDEIARVAIGSAEREQADYLDSICGPKSDREVYVVEHDSEIVAFCAVALDQDSKVGEIDLNAVEPDYQGGGVGTWMYAFALARMKEAGMLVATVGTGGDPSHAPARRAYEKAGFGPALPSLHMYRSL
ncbi:MAG: GNAT family N-acetyltransferase [Alphaproteobacteria bacterium]|nr:GNAT family N-acetyltransferase [Alphaproteobacteria bacterium]